MLEDIPVYCINLASAVERWDAIRRRCAAERILPPQRWVADTPDTLLTDGVYASYLTPPQKACASSHLRLWRHFLEETNHEMILILEDDAVFLRGWDHLLASFLEECSTSWDAIFLNVSDPIEPLYTWTPITRQCMTAAYLLHRRGALFLVERFRHEYVAADFMTQHLQARGASYSYFPWLVVQDGSPSTIQKNNDPDYQKMVSTLRHYGFSLSEYRF